jgi:hypothetical protein
MIERQRSYRGISARAAVGYLENLDGKRVEEGVVEGRDGCWRASLSEERVDVGPSLKLTEVTVAFEGENEDALDRLVEEFSRKAIRAGG